MPQKDFSKCTERQLYTELIKIEKSIEKLHRDYKIMITKRDKLKQQKNQVLKALELINASSNLEQNQ